MKVSRIIISTPTSWAVESEIAYPEVIRIGATM